MGTAGYQKVQLHIIKGQETDDLRRIQNWWNQLGFGGTSDIANISAVAESAGTSTLWARGDHVHLLGDIGGDWDAGSHKIKAEQFESDIAGGTAPLIVASNTLVTNLNADLLDGQEGAWYQDSDNLTGLDDIIGGSGIAVTDGSGTIIGGNATIDVGALTANHDWGAYQIRALQFYADATTGTAPLLVDSITLVSNLNTDYLDSQHGAYYLDSANFTGTNWTDLTDAGPTTLHKHNLLSTFAPYPDNPILSPTGDEDFTCFSSVVKVDATYHMYYTYYSATDVEQVGHATSSDGKTWTKDAGNNPVLEPSGTGWDSVSVGIPMVWKEDATWYMLYRGKTPDQGVDATGLATSSDGVTWSKSELNPVLEGTVAEWDAEGAEIWGVIKVGSTYYTYYETNGATGRETGIATSTNLTDWTKDENNPIFITGRYCPFAFKYNGLYYLIVPHYTTSTDYAEFELYRDTSPTFYSDERAYLGIVYKSSDTGWDQLDIDTPCLLTDDIFRDSFSASGGELWLYYAGLETGPGYDNGGETGLLISSPISGAWQIDLGRNDVIRSVADDATYTGLVTNDSGVLKYRTKAEVLSDIEALPLAGGTVTGSVIIDGTLGIGAAAPATTAGRLLIQDSTLSTTTLFRGLNIDITKTAGTTTEADDMYGSFTSMVMNHTGSTIGHLTGAFNYAYLVDGTVGDGQEDIRGTYSVGSIAGGVAANDLFGSYSFADVNAGTVSGDVYGSYSRIDIEAAATAVSGDVYGHRIQVDDDQGAAGTVYMLYLSEFTGVDYGIYQGGTAANYLQGATHIGTASDYTEIEAGGDVNFVGGGGLQFGEIDAQDNAVETAIGTAGVAVQVTIFDTDDDSNGAVTPDHTNDHITVGVAGHFLVLVSATVNSVSGAASRFEMTVKKNNGASSIIPHCDRNLAGGGGESGVISMSGFADLAAADTVEVWIENETNTQNYVVENISLSVMQVGGT